jgi:hypothetical protein
MSAYNLEPCPFCDCKDEPEVRSRSGGSYWEVVCSGFECGAGMTGDTEVLAIESWNRRPIETKLKHRVEVLTTTPPFLHQLQEDDGICVCEQCVGLVDRYLKAANLESVAKILAKVLRQSAEYETALLKLDSSTVEGEVKCLQYVYRKRVLEANKEVTDAFDAIFPYVLECYDDHGNPHTLSSKIKILGNKYDRLLDAVDWALGKTDFRERKIGEGSFWWRKELKERAGYDT